MSNEHDREIVVQRHDELDRQYETNERILAMETEIAQTQAKIDNHKVDIDN